MNYMEKSISELKILTLKNSDKIEDIPLDRQVQNYIFYDQETVELSELNLLVNDANVAVFDINY